MAESLLPEFIARMAEMALSYLRSQYNWSSNMRNDFGRLITTSEEISAVVSRVENRQIVNGHEYLLNEMKEAVYEAEDMKDKFDYLHLKAQEDRRNKRVRYLTSSGVRICMRLVGLDDLQTSLSELCKKLERVNSFAQRLPQLAQVDAAETGRTSANGEVQRQTATSSLIYAEEFIGREKEQTEIREALLESCNEAESSSRASNGGPTVLFIAGDSGLGKTTLAQHIYNHVDIRSNFEIRMWVHVSDCFDVTRLTKDILEELGTRNDASHSFNTIQATLKQKLDSKRFLLVLDNLWDDIKISEWNTFTKWRTLLAPLQHGKKGSAILVTTRMSSIAEQLSSRERKPVYLGPLNSKSSWLFFKKVAFRPEIADSEEMREFKHIGWQISKKLNGSPLALNIVANRLKHNTDLNKWKKFLANALSSNSCKFPQQNKENSLMDLLTSSYNSLPLHLQRCFSFCSLFPKGWVFQPDKLVHMWIAGGVIKPQDGNESDYTRMQDQGLSYFTELCDSSFFQTLWPGDVKYYVMHDLMNELAVSVSKGEYRRIESSDPATMKIPSTVVNISITVSELGRLESLTQLSKLRTLLVINSSEGCSKAPPKEDHLFRKLRAVRILDVSGYWLKQLPQVIKPLIHLRYLAFGNSFASLPKGLHRLYHLQYLYVHGKHVNITMRHLEVPHIQESGELCSVKNGQKFEEASDTDWLQGTLRIKSLEEVESRKKARNIQLQKKERIKNLELQWDPSSTRTCENDVKVLDALKPHKTLSVLAIKGNRGFRSPSWLKNSWLEGLSSLHLVSCKGWKELPPLGDLPLLRILHIRGMHAVTRIGPRFFGDKGKVKIRFPSLEVLIFGDMPRWVEWTGLQGTQLFPSLRKFEIWRCRRLMGIPAFIPPRVFRKWKGDSLRILHPHHVQAIEELFIIKCDELMPARGLVEFISLRELYINSCSRLLTSINREQKSGEGGGLLPPSIVYLQIFHCEVTSHVLSRCFQSLTSLSNLTMGCIHNQVPWELDLQHFKSLKFLDISACRNLTTFTGVGTLTSLFMLSMLYCGELSSLPAEMSCLSSLRYCMLYGCNPAIQRQFDEMRGPEWDKIAHINTNLEENDMDELSKIWIDKLSRMMRNANV
ncbi:putative disease resistance RPP13-like protein 1 [Typha angustifolia]|uniref:putative disease resistance RPP13-like protein 1 n=1 Tax=Typha angustifolia TaxID=59011 RepID=UPI003C2D4C2F